MTLQSKLPRYGFDTLLLQLIGYQVDKGGSILDALMLIETCDHKNQDQAHQHKRR